MSDLIRTIIVTIVVSGCAFSVILGIVKIIGNEYRKTTKFTGESIEKAIANIPTITKATITMLEQHEEEKKEKAARKAWEEEKAKKNTMSCKDDPNWGIM